LAGKRSKTGNLDECRIPHDHKHIIGKYHKAGAKEVAMAIEVALEAREKWTSMPWEDRIAIFQRAAQLLATKYRHIINAATMLNQSKNAFQAEIDSACELIDFSDSIPIMR